MIPRMQIVCETGERDSDGNIRTILWDPYAFPAEGDVVLVKDDQTGEEFTGRIVFCETETLDDGITRVDLRIAV